ncbi:hypothetical protein [Actinokineospora globicatena]|uniref:hypothetical protein n=1 Tax=Actinokineospora globicatena TaxID=103729 RepID=UPI0020A3D6BC|nr:hypothetical protein [Actinokineospora globicatena]MCP2303528.1 hypothetical protein [Actinokineospora globicatena]GLW79335.1 hypothetical protein Aglo01_38170 [Actinokineospora globicatena]GLW86255.1 hypothetical protein Aglo02_38940 [Actinokineospora globicatena]
MAGDINLNEQLVTTADGHHAVAHEYGELVVAAVPEGTATLAAVDEESLDELAAIGLAALRLRESTEYAEAKSQRPLDGASWDDGDAPDADDDADASAVDSGAPLSARLTGRVAVGIVIVDGPTADLQFSAAERTKVVAEVQNGLGWLGAQSSPGGVTWVYDVRTPSITAQPDPSATDAAKEPLWRDPALKAIGFDTAAQYAEKLRDTKNSTWAYVAFFTKYPVRHFAYASIGGPRLVMQYSNDGWGVDNIDRVFAHETGHIFGAPDEYASSGCDCGGSWGPWGKPNANCETCAPSGGEPCIMKSNSWTMCAHTPWHLGFPQGQRYSGVFTAGTGGHGLWVNADWSHFVAKWQEWSAAGLRLDELEISKPGGNLRYSGVFTAGAGGHGLWALVDWDSFVAKWQEWSAQGLRLVDLDITEIDGKPRYSGVFRAGAGGYGLWVNAEWSNFVAKWQEWSAAGLRLDDLTVTTINGQLRYSGVFSAGTGGYGLWALADWDSFVAKWQEWSAQGLRLVDLDITEVNGQRRYSGVFRTGVGGYGLWVNTDWTSFLEKWQEWSAGGLRLVDFDITLTGIEPFAVTEADTGHLIEAAAEPHTPHPAGLGFTSLSLTPTPGDLIHNALDTGTTDPSPGIGHLITPSHAGQGERSPLDDLILPITTTGFGAMTTQ